jgi:transcriptional regulator with XRE-family HTH domain
MDIAKIIAGNLTALMESYPGRETLEKVAHVSGVGFSTVRRAKNGDGNLTVQNLDLIAKAFRRSAKDLLVDPAEEYGQAAPVTVLSVHEPPLDERELLQGYRDASQEVREILIDLARKATRKKDFGPRSERND